MQHGRKEKRKKEYISFRPWEVRVFMIILITCQFCSPPHKQFLLCMLRLLLRLWGFRFIDKDMIGSPATLMYSSRNCGFGSFRSAKLTGVSRLFTAKDYPSIEVCLLFVCIRWQVAEGHKVGNGGCNCGGKLPSGRVRQIWRNPEPERWALVLTGWWWCCIVFLPSALDSSLDWLCPAWWHLPR